MKKIRRIIALLICTVLILTACGTGPPNPAEIVNGGELSGTLSISSEFVGVDYYGWYTLAKGFAELHPNVEIEVNDTAVDLSSVEHSEVMLALEKYRDDLTVNMFAGNSPDIIYNTSDYVTDFMASGLVFDLYEFMDSDPDFNKEDYFTGIFEAFEHDGKLYNMPSLIGFNSVVGRKDVLSAVGVDLSTMESVDYEFLYDSYYKVLEDGSYPEITHFANEDLIGKMAFASNEMAACYDNEAGEINFENEQFVDYLNVTNNYEKTNLIFSSIGVGIGDLKFNASSPKDEGASETFLPREKYLFTQNYILFESLISEYSTTPLMFGESERISEAIPVANSKGEILPVNGGYIAIPTTAKNPKLAWEFLKYCIEESETVTFNTDIGKWNGDRFGDSYIPINKNNFKKYTEAYAQANRLPQEYVDEYIDYVNEVLSMPLATQVPGTSLYKALNELQFDFYDGLMTAEECAGKMQNRADIYFGEVG